MFKNKILMITGGTGSFGTAVLQRLIHSDLKEIRIFSRDEKKQEDLRINLNNPKVKFYLGDVRDYKSILFAMKNVDYVFSAAALKQVPSCEFYPLEAIKTNILGSENVMQAAIESKVSKVVMLSTDKAVYPINAMGMSKALMEKVMIAKARMQNETETLFCATRYGNVMASRGSVIPLFVEQLKNSSPITITDPSMTRFLMSLEDSVDLVLYAFIHAKQGDIFVQKAPASTVYNLALALLDIFNKKNHPIITIGTRHGEKLYETLVSREEISKAEDMEHYYRIPSDNRDLNYGQFFSEGDKKISKLDDYTSHNTKRLDVSEVKKLLMKLDYIKTELNA
jgi:UDP-N-acetylglucosamine 4,6-dehydratase